jgi:penicillin-binding protein 1A
MGFAHQGLELKPIPGLEPVLGPQKPALVANAPTPPGGAPGTGQPVPQQAGYMSRRTFDVVSSLGNSFRSVEISGGRGALKAVPQADAGWRSTVR